MNNEEDSTLRYLNQIETSTNIYHALIYFDNLRGTIAHVYNRLDKLLLGLQTKLKY